jgi:hypothetical protein
MSAANALRLEDKITTSDQRALKASGYSAGTATSEVAGSYNFVTGLIRIAMESNVDPRSTAIHESWHSLEALLTPDEIKLLRRETPRLREVAAHFLGWDGAAQMEAEGSKLSTREVWASSAEAYIYGNHVKGIHIAVRRVFDRLARIIRQVRNYLEGLGFRTADDVFDAAWGGDIKARGAFNEDVSQASADEIEAYGPRRHGFSADAAVPVATSASIDALKAHPDYAAAKAGDIAAATRLVADLVSKENVEEAKRRFGSDVIYLPVVAQEASGHNALPRALATYYAVGTGARAGHGIIQANRAFHTGASAMERLATRAVFEGPVEAGGRYVAVDDASVMGSTLADLANHIQDNGGAVVGTVLLVNASRSGTLAPESRKVREIERRFGDVIRDTFDIEPAGLTADEASYVLNFRDADALRDRAAASDRQRTERLRAKGLHEGRGDSEEALSGSRRGPTAFVDMGSFPVDPDVPLGKQAQDYVLRMGRETGFEFLVAIDRDGSIVAHGHGSQYSTGMPASLEAALLDRERLIAVHHNHPSNSSFSPGDIGMLAAQGLNSVWAHGHDGTVARAALTDAARKATASQRASEFSSALKMIATAARNAVYDDLQDAVSNGLSADEAQLALSHLQNVVLHNAGIIDYRSNLDEAGLVDALDLTATLVAAAEEAARSLFNDSRAPSDLDRRPRPLRHVGDLGAVFEGTSDDSVGNSGSGGTDRIGPASDREEEGFTEAFAARRRRRVGDPNATFETPQDRAALRQFLRRTTMGVFWQSIPTDTTIRRKLQDRMIDAKRIQEWSAELGLRHLSSREPLLRPSR